MFCLCLRDVKEEEEEEGEEGGERRRDYLST